MRELEPKAWIAVLLLLALILVILSFVGSPGGRFYNLIGSLKEDVGGNRETVHSYAMKSGPRPPDTMIVGGGGESEMPAHVQGIALAAMAASQAERYLVRNGSLTVEAKGVKVATLRIVALVQGGGGYVADMRGSTDSLGNRTATIQVRIPFRRFEKVLQQIEGLGKVLNKQVTGRRCDGAVCGYRGEAAEFETH